MKYRKIKNLITDVEKSACYAIKDDLRNKEINEDKQIQNKKNERIAKSLPQHNKPINEVKGKW